MKVKNSEIRSFLKNLTAYKGALIYGPDIGKAHALVSAVLQRLGQVSGSTLCIREFSYEEVLADPEVINLELAAVDFFEATAPKIVLIRDVTEKANKALIAAINNMRDFGFCTIFLAGNLSNKSAMRTMFEAAINLASVACYEDSREESEHFIGMLLRRHELQCDSQAIAALVDAAGNNRMLLTSEINKLDLYLGGRKKFDAKDVKECCLVHNQKTIHDFCIMLANRDTGVLDLLSDLLYRGEKILTIMRYAQNYFSQLFTINCLRQSGKNIEDAIAGLKPPIFFKLMPIIKKQLGYWDMIKSKNIVQSLLLLEVECKSSSGVEERELFVFFINRIFMGNLLLRL